MTLQLYSFPFTSSLETKVPQEVSFIFLAFLKNFEIPIKFKSSTTTLSYERTSLKLSFSIQSFLLLAICSSNRASLTLVFSRFLEGTFLGLFGSFKNCFLASLLWSFLSFFKMCLFLSNISKIFSSLVFTRDIRLGWAKI